MLVIRPLENKMSTGFARKDPPSNSVAFRITVVCCCPLPEFQRGFEFRSFGSRRSATSFLAIHWLNDLSNCFRLVSEAGEMTAGLCAKLNATMPIRLAPQLSANKALFRMHDRVHSL